MENLPVPIVSSNQHNRTGSVYFVAWDACKFATFVIHLVLGAGVKLPREAVQTGAADAQHAQWDGREERESGLDEGVDGHGSDGS